MEKMTRRYEVAGMARSSAASQSRMCSGLKEPRGRDPR
ncbi:hypothetical protein SFR_5420 [Streptomyces sp. FR-008]|nr:hypothetical protein SFR_5420 [Streptomyces sp. FR-008]